MSLDPRQERILLAILREYILTAEPVGSQTLLSRYNLECSSATIRSEMARLEEMGYLSQPHPSAGRVPMDKSYRFYVDRLMARELPPPPEADEIHRDLESAASQVESLVEETSRILVHLTRYTSLVLAPRLRRSLFKYLQLSAVDSRHILLVMLTHTGVLLNKVVEVSAPVDPHDLEKLTNLLNDRLQSRPLEQIQEVLQQDLPRGFNRAVAERVREAAREFALAEEPRVVHGGTTQLFDLPEFRDLARLRVILEVLEEEKLVAEILSKSLNVPRPQVMIGHENELAEMQECALVTMTYRLGDEPVGTLGILGPTRMPYDKVLSVVGYLAEQFSARLSQISGI